MALAGSALTLTLAACGGGGSSGAGDSTATVGPANASPSAMVASATTGAAGISPTAAARVATPTTAAATATRAASPTATRVASPTATATGQAVASPTNSTESPLGQVTQIDPQAFPNYTLVVNFDGQNLPDTTNGGMSSAQVAMKIQQSAPDNYYMLLKSDTTQVEVWKVDGVSYVNQGGQIMQVPADSGGGLFTPSMFLQSVPQIPETVGVGKVGTDKIEGRPVTQYRVDAENIALFLGGSTGQAPEISNPSGSFNLWLDDELKIMLKANSDARWTNADGSAGAWIYDLSVTNIGATTPVTAPQ